MDIIFVKLPSFLINISIFIRKLGFRVFYISIPGAGGDPEKSLVNKLKHADVLPLQLESLPFIDNYSETDSDPEMLLYKHTEKIASESLLKGFKKLYPANRNIVQKLQIIIHANLAEQMAINTGRINFWAKSNPNVKHLLIDLSLSGFLIKGLAPNVKLLVLPFDIFSSIINNFKTVIHKLYFLMRTNKLKEGITACYIENKENNSDNARVAYVVHKGLEYGNLFQKDLFYSKNADSELFPENLLHLDYSGYPSPSEKLIWEPIGNHKESCKLNILNAITAFWHGIFHLRHFNQIPAFFILIKSYVIYHSFIRKLKKYQKLECLLIDYEILCPKELLLACETLNIRTVAVNERFIFSMNYYLVGSTILSDYLCASPFAIENMKLSPLYCIDNYIPVGQYRSDILLEYKNDAPPQIIKEPKLKGKKIITALGFHTHMTWQDSQADPLINWSSHLNFLEDMIKLSTDLPEVHIVLRYKDVSWLSLPVFSKALEIIESSENIVISKEYEKSYYSYDLCAHSDLVIAKHTSLADECLSVGIPVLFHEYTHNIKGIVTAAFDYSPTRIMCYNYEELLERSRIVLDGSLNSMTRDYEYLKKKVYGDLGDGKVRERIHNHIQEILS